MPLKLENKGFSLNQSDIRPVGDTIVLDTPDATQTHCFAGAQFFSDANGTPVVPSSGTVTITIETVNNEPIFEAVPENVISANAPLTITWAANTKRVKATPASIVGATHYMLVISTNQN